MVRKFRGFYSENDKLQKKLNSGLGTSLALLVADGRLS